MDNQTQNNAQTQANKFQSDNINVNLTSHTQNFRTKDGRKRDSVQFNVPTLTSESLNSYVSLHPEAIITVLNDSLLQQAKKLFLENTDNWDYIPQPEDYSLLSIAESLTAPRQANTRILTKANLALIANWYLNNAQEFWNVSSKAANTGATIIADGFKSHIGNKDIVAVFLDRLSNLTEDQFNTLDEEGLLILSAIIDLLSDSLEAKDISADDI